MNLAAMNFAIKKGASKEEAEDFSQWLELQKLEGHSSSYYLRRFVDFRRETEDWRYGRKAHAEASKRVRRQFLGQLRRYAKPNQDDFALLLKELPEKERNIIILRFKYDLTVPQVARLLGWSIQHISDMTGKALRRMKSFYF